MLDGNEGYEGSVGTCRQDRQQELHSFQFDSVTVEAMLTFPPRICKIKLANAHPNEEIEEANSIRERPGAVVALRIERMRIDATEKCCVVASLKGRHPGKAPLYRSNLTTHIFRGRESSGRALRPP